jgi:hypothetical protein
MSSTTQNNNENVPHIRLIVHILQMSDKLARNFISWSVISTLEMESVSVTLKEDATIDATIVNLICSQYPGRIRGPFLTNKTMIIDFLKNPFRNSQEDQVEIDDINEPLCTKSKYEYDDKEDKWDITDTERAKHELLSYIRKYNNPRVDIGNITTGLDHVSIWISFPFLHVDRLNIGFISEIMTNQSLSNVKVISVLKSS